MNFTDKTKTLSAVYKKLICSSVNYFNGDYSRFIINTQNRIEFSPITSIEQSKLVTVISRKYYSEAVHKYPIDDKAELIKLLKLEFQEQPKTFFQIMKIQDGNALVNVWQFSELCPESLVYIPESLLIGSLLESQSSAEIKTQPPLYVASSNDATHSSLSSVIINDINKFSMSVGVSQQKEVIQIAQNDFASVLAYGLSKLNINKFISLVEKPSNDKLLNSLKKLFIPFSLVFTSYLAIASSYLVYQEANLKEQLSKHNDSVDSALNIQQNVDAQLEQFNAIADLLEGKQATSVMWLVIHDLFKQVKFSNIRMVNGRTVLRGSTAKATLLLEQLSKIPYLEDAKFDYPTRSRKDIDVFVISFNLNLEKLVFANNKKTQQVAVKEHNNG